MTLWWLVYKQVYYQLISTITDLQKYSYMFWLQPVGFLRELQYSETYTLLLCDLLVVNGKIYKCMSLYYYISVYSIIIIIRNVLKL